MRVATIVALTTTALMLAPVASAGVKNACTLVTAADASKALATKASVKKKHSNVAGFNTCVYTLGKVTVTVKTRVASHDEFIGAVRSISGTALAAPNVSPDAWVFFVTHGIGLADWKNGNQVGLAVVGAGAGTNVIVAQLATTARSRIA